MAIAMRKIFKNNGILLAIGVIATILILLLYGQNPWFLKLVDYRIYDTMLRSHPAQQTSNKIVIVDLDEKSLLQVGQWPWPRHRLAVLLDNLKHSGALAVGMDIVFAEKDRTSPLNIREQLMQSFPDAVKDIQFTGLPPILMDNDYLFAEVLKGGPFVLGYTLLFEEDQSFIADRWPDKDMLGKISVAVKSTLAGHKANALHHMFRAKSAVYPYEVLLKAAPATGFFTTGNDADGVIRRVPLLISKNEHIYPNLALATLLQAWEYNSKKTFTPLIKVQDYGAESIKVGPHVIPVDGFCRVMVNYRGNKGMFPYISASDIIDQVPKALEQIAGKFVFIGTSAKGLEDIRTTPFTPLYPGVEVHATILDNILTEQFIKIPYWARDVEIGVTLLCGIITTLLLVWASAKLVIIPFLSLGTGLWFGSNYLFTQKGLWISPLYGFIVLALTFTLLTLVKFWREEKQKKFIHNAFAQYLAPKIIDQIMDNPESLSLEGEEKKITIQFSDIRNFTSLSEKLTPTQVTNLLHDYLTPMTRLITGHSGTLDKFIGDATMAFWNAPIDVPGHEVLAVDCSIKQLKILKELNIHFKEKFGFPIAIGIGVHSGTVRVGNMGSADLFDYTIIGDNVNLASRLEGLTKFYGQEFIVSKVIKDACNDKYVFLEMDRVRVKGKKEPLTIFTLKTHEQAAQIKHELDCYNEALKLYKATKFTQARAAFADMKNDFDNKVLYNMYERRCAKLAANPPEGQWDGVFTHTTK